MKITVIDGVNRREYEGISHNDKDIHDSSRLAIVWSDGEWEIFAVSETITEKDAEEAILSYYRDSYGWPDSFHKIRIFRKVRGIKMLSARNLEVGMKVVCCHGGYSTGTIESIQNGLITIVRPYIITASDTKALTFGQERFSVYQDSNKMYEVIE